MKTSLTAALVVLTTALGSFAQGVVNFNNNVLSSPPDRLVYCAFGPMAGTNFVAQLYWSTDGGATFRAVTAAPARFRPTGTAPAGTWLGGNRTLPAGVGGVGTTIQLQVRAWDVLNPNVYGSSQTFDYQQVLSAPPAAADTYMKNFVGFVMLSCIPEPAAILLLAPAFAALWFLRRSRNH